MLSSGAVLANRYRVVRPLGGGGMKMVYLVEDTRLASRPCALAEMIDSFTDPKEAQAAATAFQREAEMLASLHHDHIVVVHDRFSEQNRHYLVMEYVEGETLEQKLVAAPGSQLDENLVVDAAMQILDALEYLHRQNPPVIYRDLKPANVMLTPSGRVKMIDFGIARLFIPKKTATMVGTQGYAPPEQYEGKAEPRSDLYSLGATMFHLLTGWDPALHPPFMYPAIRNLRPDLAPALAALVTESLTLEASSRIGSATEFRRRLMNLKNLGSPPLLCDSTPAGALMQSPNAPTVFSSAPPLCPQCSRQMPADAQFCPYCSADLNVVEAVAPSQHQASVRVAYMVGALLALFFLALGAVYYIQQYKFAQQRLATARAKPLVLKGLVFALSTRLGQPLDPPTTSFTDVEIARAKYLKWSATFDNALAGLESANEKIEARFLDSRDERVATSVAERYVGSTDKEAAFSSVVLMPESRETNGTYRVGLYLGDQKLGEGQFTVTEEIGETTHPKSKLPTEARDFIDKIERDARAKPNDIAAWDKFGAVSMRAAMFDQSYYHEAKVAYDHVLQLDADNLDALRGIGDINYDKQHYEEAIVAYEQYLKKKPDDPEVLTDLGTMYLYVSKTDQAVVLYQKAIVAKPGFFQAYYNLGIAYAQQNNVDYADAALKQALALAPDDTTRGQVRDLIAKLNSRSAPR